MRVAAVIGCALLVAAASAEDQLPRDPAPDSFEVEPPLLIPNAAAEPSQQSQTNSPAPLTPAELERKLERAKSAAAEAQRLVKIGVLAKAEGEERALRVLRVEAELATARLAEAREFLAGLEQRVRNGEADRAELAAAEAAVRASTAAEQRATERRRAAEIEAAAINLKRQQKLLALGSGHKADVHRAEEKLTQLQQQAQ